MDLDRDFAPTRISSTLRRAALRVEAMSYVLPLTHRRLEREKSSPALPGPRARQTPVKTAVGVASEASLPSLGWSRVAAPLYFTCPPRSARPCGCGAKEATNSTPPHPARNKGKTVRSLHRSTRGTGPTEPHVIDPYAPGALAAVLTAPAGGLPLT